MTITCPHCHETFETSDKPLFPAPEKTLAALLAKHDLAGKKTTWRITDPDQGYVNGLPNTRGTLRATDGVLCIIELADGRLFEGHLEWFLRDPKDKQTSQSARTGGKDVGQKTTSKTKKEKTRPSWKELDLF